MLHILQVGITTNCMVMKPQTACNAIFWKIDIVSVFWWMCSDSDFWLFDVVADTSFINLITP